MRLAYKNIFATVLGSVFWLASPAHAQLAPTITSPGSTTFVAGSAGSFAVTTMGTPTPNLIETGTLPSGVSFGDNSDGTGTLSGTATSGGVYNFGLTATNGISPDAVQSFTLTVDQAPAITSAANATFAAGASAAFTVTTTGFPTAAITESGALPSGITFIDNGNGTATLGGSAAILGKFPVVFTATDGVGTNAVQNFTLTIGKFNTTTSVTSNLNPAVYGQSIAFNAIVTASGGVPSGSVVFQSGTTVLGTASLSGGSATLSTTFLPAGKNNIYATYTATPNYATSKGAVSQTVQKVSTQSVVTNASPSPSIYGQGVTITASVTSTAGTPTGSFTFTLGATTLGTAVLSNGTASYTSAATQLPGGKDTIRAQYGGDTNFLGSTSTGYLQQVNGLATGTTLTSSQNPSTAGKGVTLTAAVSSTAGTPTGNVVFQDGTTILGTVALNGGGAQLTTTFLAGTHNLSATYSQSSNYATSSGKYTQVAQGGGSSASIQHIVVIFQENRTPDNLFHGLAGADIADTGINSQGQTIPLQKIDLAIPYDPLHGHNEFLQMYDNGKMDGADKIVVKNCPTAGCPTNPQFAYVDPTQVAPYFQLAETYTFGDRMFQSNQGPSFPAHQYIIAGTSAPSVGGLYAGYLASEEPLPKGPTGCVQSPSNAIVRLIDPAGVEKVSIFPCFEHPTLMDSLDTAGISWLYYGPYGGSTWTAPNAIQHLSTGPDWSNVIYPETRVLTDIAAGKLAQVVWVIPDGKNSDHASGNDGSGPAWVASIVNAIGNSPYWSSTAIIVTWDDWGGWYDHVAPPIYNVYEYGFRVPLIVVSPYAKKGYVSHITHDFGSILHFIESVFALPSLGYADARADDLSDCFDYSQPVGTYTPVSSNISAAQFIERAKTAVPTAPDDD